MNRVIKFLKDTFPALSRNRVIRYAAGPFIRKYRPSYAQCGEDMILKNILNKPKGFYIDIGANNPVSQSNTMYFYKQGWHGINIDATPGAMDKFRKLRKRDLNIEAAIASEEKEMVFCLFKSSFYNRFENQSPDKHNDELLGKKLIRTTRLSGILDQHLPKNN